MTIVAPSAIGDALAVLRAAQPLVQCLTNVVVAQWTANVLLAAGASPAMVDQPQEAAELAAVAGGVLVNLGTPTEATVAGMHAAAQAAHEAGRPWVLDPVAAGALGWRTGIAADLLAAFRPTIVRGNASEVLALGGGTGGRGVESVDSPDAAAPVARVVAKEHGTVVAVSGPIDLITDGSRSVRVANGHEWLTRVTGAGCSLGALCAGFAGVVEDPLVAAVAATATLTVAADRAARVSAGPGSFAVALLDALAAITPDELADEVELG